MAEIARSGPLAHKRVDAALLALVTERLDYFVRAAFEIVHPDKEFVREPYLEPLCFALQQVFEKDTARLQVSVPPRHLKSFIAAVALPAFILARSPSFQFGVVSYSQELAREHTALFNRLVQSHFYRRAFPHVQFRDLRQDAAVTTRNGGRKSFTVGGSFTGMGVDGLVLDDMIKAGEVVSALVREELERFYSETVQTRFNDPTKVKLISIQQRLHPDDLISRIIDSGVFECLNLPSIALSDTSLPLYRGHLWPRLIGDLLSPTRFPKETLDDLQTTMGPAAFSAQFQGEPLPDGSMIVEIQKLHFVEEPFDRASLQYVALSIDPAVKDTDQCDYSVITVWGYDGTRWRLLDMVRGRFVFPDLEDATRAAIATWQPDKVIIEDSHTGSALWHLIRRDVPSAVALTPQGSKIERLAVGVGLLYSGQIVFPRNAPFMEVVLRELRAFPSGRHDDIVDSLSQFLNWRKLSLVDHLVDAKNGKRRRPTSRRRTRR